jgi:hypothetical protein
VYPEPTVNGLRVLRVVADGESQAAILFRGQWTGAIRVRRTLGSQDLGQHEKSARSGSRNSCRLITVVWVSFVFRGIVFLLFWLGAFLPRLPPGPIPLPLLRVVEPVVFARLFRSTVKIHTR